MGDDPQGRKPEAEGHDAEATVVLRRRELSRAVEILGVDHHEMLGYRDSGMDGWPQNSDARAFMQAPLEEAAAKLAALFQRYRPDVVVTYGEDGIYGHPDHIKAHQITVAAAASTAIPAKLYFTALPRSRMEEFQRRTREAGARGGSATPEESGVRIPGTPDEEITTFIDVSSVVERKLESVRAHESQMSNFGIMQLAEDELKRIFGTETYVRARDRTGAPIPESDLFAGLR
jgi:LmbE family N-acetylglucosaminyl deacetylase